MDFKEASKKVLENRDLANSLVEVLDRSASLEEIEDILSSAGIEPEATEALVAEYQKKRGEKIAVQELDDNSLEQVAGGGDGKNCDQAVDCDSNFKNSEYWDKDRCSYSQYCDEYYACALSFMAKCIDFS